MKGNLLQGTARGSLGDTVFYRTNGEQMARVRIRNISNPRSFPQLLNRVILNTVAKSYALLKPVCDHSFQNVIGPRKNQSEYMRRNVKMLQDKMARFAVDGDFRVAYREDGSFVILIDRTSSFNGRTDPTPLWNEWIISAGTVPSFDYLVLDVEGGYFGVQFPQVGDIAASTLAVMTWAEFAAAVGVPAGSQLTFVFPFSTSNSDAVMDSVRIYRMVLRDADEATDSVMFSLDSSTGTFSLNNPHPQNIGNPAIRRVGEVYQPNITFDEFAGNETFMSAGVICSYLQGTTWMRSNCVLRVTNEPVSAYSVGRAAESYLGSSSSAQLLNQAN